MQLLLFGVAANVSLMQHLAHDGRGPDVRQRVGDEQHDLARPGELVEGHGHEGGLYEEKKDPEAGNRPGVVGFLSIVSDVPCA